jgi:hypothetical protein
VASLTRFPRKWRLPGVASPAADASLVIIQTLLSKRRCNIKKIASTPLRSVPALIFLSPLKNDVALFGNLGFNNWMSTFLGRILTILLAI